MLRVLVNIIRNKEIVDLEVALLMERCRMNWRVNYVPILNTMLEEINRVEINNAWFHGDYTRNFVEDCAAYDVVLGTFQMKLMNLTGCSSDESHLICTKLFVLLQEFLIDMELTVNKYIRDNHIDQDTMTFNFMVEDVIGGQVGGEFYLIERPMGIHEVLTEDADWLIPANSYRAGNLAVSAATSFSGTRW